MLAGFLAFCGCEAVVLDEAECPPPTGWKRAKTHSVFGLAPGRQLPLPEADASLWQSLAKNTEPAAGKAADMLFPDRPSKRDDFYSELCSKRSRGLARVWTLEREGNIICTVGAYALANGQAYMACGETVEALRGKGGLSSRWRMPSPPKAGCLSSCAAPSGCISIPGWALRRWGSMHDMKYNNN